MARNAVWFVVNNCGKGRRVIQKLPSEQVNYRFDLVNLNQCQLETRNFKKFNFSNSLKFPEVSGNFAKFHEVSWIFRNVPKKVGPELNLTSFDILCQKHYSLIVIILMFNCIRQIIPRATHFARISTRFRMTWIRSVPSLSLNRMFSEG